MVCSSTTVDLSTPCGADIPIEERPDDEVTRFAQQATAPEGITVRNPVFDITPARLVSGIITECGLIRLPYDTALQQLFEHS